MIVSAKRAGVLKGMTVELFRFSVWRAAKKQKAESESYSNGQGEIMTRCLRGIECLSSLLYCEIVGENLCSNSCEFICSTK